MVLHQTAEFEGRITKLEAKQMSGLATPHRITGDMGDLLSDGSDDEEWEEEEEEEEEWDDEEWDEEDDGINPDDEPDLWMGDEEDEH